MQGRAGVVLLLALAGCILGPPPATLALHATWIEPGLYGALNQTGVRGNWTLGQTVVQGFDFHDAGLDAMFGPAGSRVTDIRLALSSGSVLTLVPDRRAGARFGLDAPGDASNELARDALQTMARALFSLDQRGSDALWDRFVQSARNDTDGTAHFSPTIDAKPTLEPWASTLSWHKTRTTWSSIVGFANGSSPWRGHAWSLDLSVATRSIHGAVARGSVHVEVAADDHAEARLEDPTNPPDDGVHDLFVQVFEACNVTAPHLPSHFEREWAKY